MCRRNFLRLMRTSSLAADRTPTVVRLPPRIAVCAPPERSRTVVRLVLWVWLLVAAPPDDSWLAALRPILRSAV